jgi:tetratricopeptide (TPR) repeat protein
MMQWNTARRMAERDLWLGRLDQAAEFAERARVLSRELRLENGEPIHVALMAKIFEAQGRFDDAAALWEPWIDRIHLIGFRYGLAHSLFRGGRREDAATQWRLGTDGEFADVDRGAHWLETMGLAAEVAYFLNDAPRGRVLRALLAPYTGHVICSGVGAVCTTEHALGVAAIAAGDLDDAVEQLERAAAIGESIGAPLLRAASMIRLGSARLARRTGDDIVQARRDLDRALAIADAHHAHGLAGEASSHLALM